LLLIVFKMLKKGCFMFVLFICTYTNIYTPHKLKQFSHKCNF